MPGPVGKTNAKQDLTSGSLVGNLARLAVPLSATMGVRMVYNLVDTFWLGRYSKQALAAPGACFPFIFIVIAFGFGFGQAGSALVAQHTGADRDMTARRCAGQTLLLLVGFSVLFALPLIAFAPYLLRLAQVPPAVLPGATGFLRIFLAGLPLMALSIGYGSVLRALGNTAIVLVIGIVTNAINVVIDPLLIFGWWGFPEWGVRGAAVATVSARLVNAAICLYGLNRGWAGLRLKLSDFKPDWPLMRKTISVGLPAAIGNSSNSVGIAVFQAMVNSLGTTVMGAVIIGFRIIQLFNVPAMAMSWAAAPVVGQALGAGKKRLARRAVRLSVVLVAAVLLLPVIALTIWGKYVAFAFTDDPAVIEQAAIFFRVVPASMYCFSVLLVLLAAYYGSGHTRPAMVIHIVRLWVLRLPVSYLLAFTVGMGSIGIYLGMVFGNVITAVITFVLYRSGGWETAVVEDEEDGVVRGADEETSTAET